MIIISSPLGWRHIIIITPSDPLSRRGYLRPGSTFTLGGTSSTAGGVTGKVDGILPAGRWEEGLLSQGSSLRLLLLFIKLLPNKGLDLIADAGLVLLRSE